MDTEVEYLEVYILPSCEVVILRSPAESEDGWDEMTCDSLERVYTSEAVRGVECEVELQPYCE